MNIYKIKMESEDFKNVYLLDVEVQSKNLDQAVQMAHEQAGKFCFGYNRVNDIQKIGRKFSFGKPKVLKVTNGFTREKNSYELVQLV